MCNKYIQVYARICRKRIEFHVYYLYSTSFQTSILFTAIRDDVRLFHVYLWAFFCVYCNERDLTHAEYIAKEHSETHVIGKTSPASENAEWPIWKIIPNRIISNNARETTACKCISIRTFIINLCYRRHNTSHVSHEFSFVDVSTDANDSCLGESISIVTGPSFWICTCIYAPNLASAIYMHKIKSFPKFIHQSYQWNMPTFDFGWIIRIAQMFQKVIIQIACIATLHGTMEIRFVLIDATAQCELANT